jgi:hypothetical protein
MYMKRAKAQGLSDAEKKEAAQPLGQRKGDNMRAVGDTSAL